VFLLCSSGVAYPFWPHSFPAEEVAPAEQFAVTVREGQVWAVPLDGDVPRRCAGRVQMRHYCNAYREHRLMASVTRLDEVVTADDLFGSLTPSA
jgi:hypothetical protein